MDGWLLAGLLLCLLAVILSVPFELELVYDSQLHKKPQAEFFWLFGWLRLNISDKQPSRRKLKPAKKSAARKGQNRSSLKAGFALFKSPGFVARLKRFVTDCLKSFHFDESRFTLRLGLSDPAETGWAMGLLMPACYWFQSAVLPTARIEPDFEQRVLHLQCATRVRASPMRFIVLVIGILFSPIVWRALWRAQQAGRV